MSITLKSLADLATVKPAAPTAKAAVRKPRDAFAEEIAKLAQIVEADAREQQAEMAKPSPADRAAAVKAAQAPAKPAPKPEAPTVSTALVRAVAKAEAGAAQAEVNLFIGCMHARVTPQMLVDAYTAAARPMAEATSKVRASTYNAAGKLRMLVGAEAAEQIIRDGAKLPGRTRDVIYQRIGKAIDAGKDAVKAKAPPAAVVAQVTTFLQGFDAELSAPKTRAPRTPAAPAPAHAPTRTAEGVTPFLAVCETTLALLQDQYSKVKSIPVTKGERAAQANILSALEDALETLRTNG